MDREVEVALVSPVTHSLAVHITPDLAATTRVSISNDMRWFTHFSTFDQIPAQEHSLCDH